VAWEPGPNGQLAPPNDYDNFPRYDIEGLYNISWRFRPQRFTLDQFVTLTAAAGMQDDFDSILIDPLGFYRMGGDTDANSLGARLFGTFEQEVINNPDGEPLLVLPRVTGGHRGNNTNTGNDPNGIPWRNRLTEAQARSLVTMPDQFSTLLDAAVVNNGFNSVELDGRVEADVMNELGGFVDSGNQLVVALFDLNGNVHMRTVAGTGGMPQPSTGRIVGFNPALPEDPFNTGNAIPIERAMIQQQLSGFTWMISARVSLPTSVSMDVVVFYNRAYSREDERIFYTRVLDSTTTTGVSGGIGAIFNKVRVDFSGVRPQAREGGYLFDTQNNRWYRILEITLETSNRLEMILEDEVLDDLGPVNADGTYGITTAFPRGVVEVFPIGLKSSKYNETPNIP
jgi:hypothetical protein